MLNEEINHHKAGRPRDPHLDEAVLEAALEVFSARGYQHASLAEIARKAGVGIPAIYRRWPNKVAIAIDVFERGMRPDPIPDTGSIRRDLIEFFKMRLRQLTSPLFSQMLLAIAGEAALDPSLAAEVRRRTIAYRDPGPVRRLRKAMASGELKPDTVPTRLLDMLHGPISMTLLFSQEPPDESEAEVIVDRTLAAFGARVKK